MYSFAQHKDVKVVDEPFYAYYLHSGQVDINHPGKAEILKSLPTKKEDVISLLSNLKEGSNKHLFIKGMAHHYLEEKPQHILNWDNVILIRHPRKILTSFSKVIENPSVNDIGIKKAATLFSYLKNEDKTPLVIDSDELIKAPRKYLQFLCEALALPFSTQMLTWQKGGIPEDGVWAPHWYKNVHNSTGFSVQKTSNDPFPTRLQSVLDEAMIYYNTLSTHILKND